MSNYTDDIGTTAWAYLVHEVKRNTPVEKFTTRELHQCIENWVRNSPISPDEHSCLWELSNDLYWYILGDVFGAEDTEYHLGTDTRHRVAYEVLKCYLLGQSVRVGKNIKREVNTQAKEMGIDAADMHDLYEAIVPDMLETIFN
jgi:hypothetical protein